MNRNGADQLRAGGGEAQGDRSAPRCSGDVRGLQTQRLDEPSQVGDVVVDACPTPATVTLRLWPRRSKVTTSNDRAKRGPDGVPGATVDPGTVHEDQRLACAAALVVQAGFVEGREGHRAILGKVNVSAVSRLFRTQKEG